MPLSVCARSRLERMVAEVAVAGPSPPRGAPPLRQSQQLARRRGSVRGVAAGATEGPSSRSSMLLSGREMAMLERALEGFNARGQLVWCGGASGGKKLESADGVDGAAGGGHVMWIPPPSLADTDFLPPSAAASVAVRCTVPSVAAIFLSLNSPPFRLPPSSVFSRIVRRAIATCFPNHKEPTPLVGSVSCSAATAPLLTVDVLIAIANAAREYHLSQEPSASSGDTGLDDVGDERAWIELLVQDEKRPGTSASGSAATPCISRATLQQIMQRTGIQVADALGDLISDSPVPSPRRLRTQQPSAYLTESHIPLSQLLARLSQTPASAAAAAADEGSGIISPSAGAFLRGRAHDHRKPLLVRSAAMLSGPVANPPRRSLMAHRFSGEALSRSARWEDSSEGDDDDDDVGGAITRRRESPGWSSSSDGSANDVDAHQHALEDAVRRCMTTASNQFSSSHGAQRRRAGAVTNRQGTATATAASLVGALERLGAKSAAAIQSHRSRFRAVARGDASLGAPDSHIGGAPLVLSSFTTAAEKGPLVDAPSPPFRRVKYIQTEDRGLVRPDLAVLDSRSHAVVHGRITPGGGRRCDSACASRRAVSSSPTSDSTGKNGAERRATSPPSDILRRESASTFAHLARMQNVHLSRGRLPPSLTPSPLLSR